MYRKIFIYSFIYWYRGEQVVNYAQRGGISVETEQRTRTSRLLIARASPHDSGNYTCAPSSSGKFHLTVNYTTLAITTYSFYVAQHVPALSLMLSKL